MRTYTREWTFFGSHFNTGKTYDVFHNIINDEKSTIKDRKADILALMRDIHGHNFKFVVTCMDEGDSPFVIEDEFAHEFMVSNFAETNYSLHPYFYERNKRATIEEMSKYIAYKIHQLAVFDLENVTVKVYEEFDRFATYYMENFEAESIKEDGDYDS
jgi:hypothetical protein